RRRARATKRGADDGRPCAAKNDTRTPRRADRRHGYHLRVTPLNVRVRVVVGEVLVLAGFAALTVLMTWPWAASIRDAASDLNDPCNSAWILWWDWHQTFHDPLNLFHGNIFYPLKYTLAFSENDYGIAVLFFPLFFAGIRPFTMQGIATLAGFALSGYGAFRLTRTLTASTGAAWIA